MSDTRVWTFVFDYRGGTYLRQLSDDSLCSAYRRALVSLADLADMKRKKLKKLVASLDEQPDDFTAIEGMNHVYCTTGLIGRHLLLVHVVETRVGGTEQVDTGSVSRSSRRGAM